MHLARSTRLIACLLVAASIEACAHPRPPVDAGGGGATTTKSTLPSGVTPTMVAEGDSLFNNKSCVKCHGPGGQHGRFAPDLTAGKWLQIDGSYDAIANLIITGVPPDKIKDPAHTLDMHPRGGMNLTDAQIKSIAGYVWTLSRAKK